MPKLQPPTRATCAKYGLTVEDWYVLLARTDGLCPCCGKTFTQRRRPVIDHDHETFEVRGLVCSPCNVAIGYRHNDAPWFRAVANYLTWPTVSDVDLQGTGRHKDAPPL
jgi:hypothetical protein